MRLSTSPIVQMVYLRWVILSMTLTLNRNGLNGTLLLRLRRSWPRSTLAKKTSCGTILESCQLRPGHSTLRTLQSRGTTQRATSSILSNLHLLQYQHSIVLLTRLPIRSNQHLLLYLLCSNICRMGGRTVTSQKTQSWRLSDHQYIIRTLARTLIRPLHINQT